MSFCNSSLTSESSLPLSRPTLPSPTCYLYMHAVPPIIWSCLRAVPSWTCRLYGRGSYVYALYYLPAPHFLSQLECSLLEHEFEEETCGRDVGVYLCERATATNGGDDNDGQKVRWTWHLSIRSSIETSGGSKIFFFIYGGVFFGHCD